MPSKCTTNYNLSQWEADDKVLRTDFNADNLAIDTALKNLNTSLSSKASSSALDSLTSTVNGLKTSKADASALSSLQTTVNGKASQSDLNSLKSTVTALQSTVAAKQDASGAVKTAWGSYVGNGQAGSGSPRTLNFSSTLGKLPELLIVRQEHGGGDGLVLLRGMQSTTMNLSGATGTGSRVEITWNTSAKTVSWYAPSASAQFNYTGVTYYYFAVG